MATEAVIVQEPVSMVEKMATEAVIIQEPISMVEKMATEAVIIAEPISMVKTEEESKHLTANDNGVETANVVPEGNHGIAKGESFLMSPEISKVADETCGVLDHTEVDGTPFKAEKIPDDEEKMTVRLEDEAGTRGIEKGDTVDGSEELKKQASMDSHDPTVESLKDAKETVTEASSTEQVNEVDDTKPEKLPVEAGKDQIILDSLGDTLTEKVAESKEIACVDEPEVDEKLEEVSSEEIKCTNVGNEELHPQAELPVGNEQKKPHEFSGIQPEEQGNEAIGASEKKEEDVEDVSKAYQSRDSTNPEDKLTEEAATIDLKSEPSRTDEENVKEDSEDCTVETMNEKSEEEITAATMSIQEVRKEHETAAAGTVKEKPEIKECLVANISNSAISDETVKEIIKEGESKPMKSTEEARNSNIEETDTIEETEKLDNDPSPFIGKELKEVIQIEVKEDHVHSSLIELKESGKDTEEETNVNEDEAEGKKNDIHNVGTVEEIGVTTEHEGIGVNSANIDVNSMDSSVTCNENVEISEPQKDGIQDEIPNAGSEDHIELTNKEIQLKEVPPPGDKVKEHFTVPSEEHEATPSKVRKITNETSDKDQDLNEHLEKVAADMKVVPDTDKESPVVMEALNEMKRDEESTVIEAENVNLVWLSEEEKSKEEIPESFQPKNEPEKEKSVCPLNVVSEDVNTSTCGETVETSTNNEEVTSINDREERPEGEKREETPTNHLQFEANESYETVEVEVSNETADDLHVTDSFIGQRVDNEHENRNEFSDVQPVENEALENKEEEILQELEDCSAEKPEPKDAVENVKDNLKPEETNEVHEGPTLIVKEDSAITDNSPKSTEEDENEDTPEVEVCEKLELDKTVEIAEKQVLDEEDNKGKTTLTAETVKEKAKEENTAAMVSMTEASNSIIEEMDPIEETAKPNNDPNMLDIVKESREELTSIQGKEDHVCSSSFELEMSKNDTEEEKPASCAAETEETNIKVAEAAEEKNERNNVVVVEERGLGTTQLEGLGVYSAEMNVKSLTEKDTEIPRDIDAMQNKVPNAGSDDQLEMNAEEIPSKEIIAYEVKEYEPDLIKEREICDETSGKDQDLYEHSEIPLSHATDEKLMQNEDSPQSDVPKAEPEHTGNGSRHEVKEHLVEEPNVEVTNVSTEEVNSEGDNQTDASEAKTLQDEKSLDLGHKTEQTEAGKPLDETTDLGETAGTYDDDEKVVKEENLAKNLEETKSLKEDSEIGKEAQIPGVVTVNDAKVEDYNTVSSEFLNEAESKEQIVEENLEVEKDSAIDGEASHVVKELEETRQGEESGDPVNVHSEDREAEKRTEEIIHDSKQCHEESCTESVTEVRAERSLNKTDENSKALSISSVETNPEIVENDANQETEVENVEPEETSIGLDADVRTNDNDDVQTLDKDEEIRIENPVEKIEEETQKTKIEFAIQVDSSETKTIEEVCLLNEEETIAGQHPQNDEHEEQNQTPSLTLPSEESEHGPGAVSEEIKYGITKEEVQTMVDAATGDEVTGEQTTSHPLLSREKDEENICTVEKTEEKINEGDMIPDKISEDFSVAETTTEICLEKEELLEHDDAKKDAAEKGEKTKEEETIKDEIEEDADDAKTKLEICSQTERSVGLEVAGEDERTDVETLAEKISDAQVLNLTSALPSKEDECESTITAETIGSEKTPDEDASLQKDGLREEEALAVDNDASSQVIPTETPDGLPDPVDALPTDHLPPTTSTLPSEAQGCEKKEIELEEEKIQEQTQEIEEASDFNVYEKSFKNELLDKAEDVAIQEKPVKARTETEEIVLDEAPAEKVIVEAQKTSANVDLVEDKTGEAPGQASVARVESTAVIEENVVLASFEEKAESESAPVAEDHIEETFPESSKRQNDETSIDVQNQDTEEQMQEEPKDKLEDERISNEEQNINETRAVILSGEVDKEVEKAEGSEGIKEYVMEKESSTDEIHPVQNGEAINQVEDYSAVSTEIIQEAKSEEQIQAENSEVEENSTNEKGGSPAMKELDEAEKGLIEVNVDELNRDNELGETKSETSKISNAEEPGEIDDIGPPNTGLEVKPEEQIQTSICTFLSEDEDIRIENPVEKIKEETQKDTEIEHESQEDSSKTKAIEEVCLSNEEQRELNAVSEEETIADQVSLNDGLEEQNQTASLTLPSEVSEHGIGEQTTKEKDEDYKEEVQTNVDAGTGDEVTGEQTTSPPLVSREKDEENICTVEKTEEKINEADMIPDMISEGFSVAETTELCREKELLELDDAKMDAAEKGEKTKEEDTIKDEIEEVADDAKTRLEIYSQTEKSVGLKAAGEDERTGVETLAEKISDAQALNLTTALPSKEDECERTIAAEKIGSEKTPDEDASLQKDGLREDEALAVDDDASSQVILTEKPDDLPDPIDTLPTDHLHPTTSTLPSEVQGGEKEEIELEEEKIPEQTQVIEEALDFSVPEKSFKNELLDKTEDVANQEKLVKASTETVEIVLDEAPAEKIIVEAQENSANEALVEDKTVEAPGHASDASTESTTVIEENIVLASFEEKAESESAPVAEDHIEETFPESSKRQDDETSIDVQNHDTEEQMKEESEDKLENEHISNGEQNTNETKDAILSEEVDKGVEKAEGNEGNKEYVMEKESSADEIHPVQNGDEAINQVEDYSAVSTEIIQEAKSEEQIQAENSEVEENSTNEKEVSPATKEPDEAEKGLIEVTVDELNRDNELGETKSETSKISNADELGKIDDIGPPNTVLEVKPEEQIQTSVCTLLSEDEDIRIENPVEKIEEEMQKDTEIEHESREDSSKTKAIEEVCLSNEEQRELKAVSEEETIADQVPLNGLEEQNQTASSTLPSEESEHGIGAINEEIKYGITKEEVQTEVDAATGVEVTGEQATSPPLVSREKDEENICTVEKTEEEKLYEANMISDKKNTESFSVAETTTELCLEKEETNELDNAEKEDEKTEEDDTIKVEIGEDAEDALEICSQTERSVRVKVAVEDERTGAETLAEKISDAQALNLTTALPSKEDECESTIADEIIGSENTPDDASLQKDGLQEDEALAVDGDASSQVILTEKPDDLPDPVDTLPTDYLHPTTSALPAEVQGGEKKEIELEEEKIPEQTQEMEEASDFNVHEKPFKNELLDKTEDVAIQEKPVKARTETEEIVLHEAPAEKVIEKTQKTSANVDLAEDKTDEAPGQASAARVESTAVIKENVVLASFEEKAESESAPVAESHIEETFPESSKRQDDEISIDVKNQDTEEQMQEEPKDKLEDERISNEEQNTNETRAVILSGEVDKGVEKAEDNEGNKEYVMEKESSADEIHPVQNGDESINQVEDYSAVSIESIQEAKSEEQIQVENSEVEENPTNEKEVSLASKEPDEAEKGLIEVTVDELNRDNELGETKFETSKISNADELGKIDDIGPPNTGLEVKPKEQIQTSVCTLLSEDENIKIENLVEKIEEETRKDAEIEHESLEDSSKTKAIEEVSLSNEEQRELKAVSEEETIADQASLNGLEEQNQIASLTLPSEESEHGTGAISGETEYGIAKEEVQRKVDAATGDEVTGEQTTSPTLVSREKDEENICTVEKTDEEKLYEANMVLDKNAEGFSVAETTTELCLEKEETNELDVAEKEDEKTKEEETIKDEIEEDAKDAKTRLEICSEMERSVELETVGKDETTAVESLAEKISDEQVLRLTTALPSKDECESTITSEMIGSEKTPDEDASLQKEGLQEDEALAVDDDASSQVILTEKPDNLQGPFDTLTTDHLHRTTSTLPSEVQGGEKKEIELEEEKIPEQTQEIEEASGFNTEIQDKAISNELLNETDVAIKEKLVKARAESGEIILDEVPAEKVVVEAQKTSENEELIESKTVEAPGQSSVARIESTTVIEENVVLAGLMEKPESESAPVAEDKSEETFHKSSTSQVDETSIDVQNQETEEQMKDEPKYKLEGEHILNREQDTNETKAVILSEEVDKEVGEDIKESVKEKESSTNEIHPVPEVDETVNEVKVEDYSAVSAECIEEAKSEEQIREVKETSSNEEGLPVMKELDEGKQDKESGDPVNVHGEDKEAEEKDEVIDDLKLSHGESHSETVIVERAETSLNDTEVYEELVNTLNISSVKTSLENSASDAGQETEEVEKVQPEEISSDLALEVPTNNNDVVEVNKRDADEFYMAKDKIVESDNGISVERVDQLNQYELVETKSEASKKSLTAELEADKVEETEGVPETSSDHTSQRVETNLKDDDSSTNTFPEEKSEEQLQSSTQTLLREDEEITTACPIEKIEEEIPNDARLKHESREDSSCTKSVEEACLLNEEQRELKTVSEEETIADKSLPNDEPEAVLESETNTPPVIAEEPEEHGATGERKIKEESFEDETPPQSECTREFQGALEDGETAVHLLPSETLADNLHATASTVPSEVKENETTETESKEDESPKKILEQTGEIEEASNLNKETCKKPFELLGETDAAANEIIARDETGGEGNKFEKTEGNEITANEDSKEEVMEDKEVTETSYSTSHSEEPMKDGYGEDKTRKELKISEIDMIETQIKDKTIEDPGQVSVAEIETIEVTEEGRSQNVPIAGFEEKPKSETEPVIEDQSNESIPENTRSQDDGTSLDVPDQETEEQIKEELKDKLEDEGNINREENTNEVTKAVILSEELEDYGAVSTECIQETKFEEQIQAKNLEVEEKKQDEKSVDPVSVHSEDREAEEKAEIIADLKLVHGESHSETVTEERAETNLNDTEVNKQLVNTSNISSTKMSLENTVSDANQESEEVEKEQLEEISSDLGPEIPSNNNDEMEVIKRDPDEFYTVGKVDQLNQDHGLIETESEPSNKSLTAELEASEVEEPEAVPETLSDHMSQRFEAILKDDDSSTNTFPEEKPWEQLQSSTRTLLSEDEEIRTAHPIEKIEEEIQNDAGIKHKIGEDSSDTKIIEEIPHQEDEALAEDNIDNASAPNILSEKPEEQIQNPAVTLPSKEHKHETINEVDKTGEMKNVDFHGEDAVEEESTEKGETREPEEMSEIETNTCQVIPEESEEHGAVTEENKIKVESFENEKITQSECTRELQGALEDGAAAVHILPGETSAVNLHPAASTLPSEVRGNETKETELKEDESLEKIQEQTREIEEVSNFNIETCGIAFDNELLNETEDGANEKKIVITNEIAGIEVLNAENVEPAPPGFQEKPESDLKPVDEDQSKETLPEHTKSQDDETRTDVQNRQTEEQAKEELKDKVETEDGINGEQNKNEITKAVILSEEVDGSEDIKEHVIEEESTTNELHPVPKEDETTNEVEDYSAVSIESIETADSEETKEVEKVQHEEASSDLVPEVPTNNNEEAEVTERDPDAFCMSKDQIAEAENGPTAELEADKVEIGVPEPLSDNVPPRVEETTLKVDSTSTNTFLEDKPKEQLQSSACTLFSIPNEEQRELKAVSEEETIADKVLPYDEPEEQIQTTSMTFPSVEREHGTGAIREVIEYGKTKEEVPINLDVVTGDEITGKQTRETNKPEEIMSSPLVSMEKEENVSSVEQIEEEKLGDAEILEKISENPFDPKKAAETCLENEAIKELDDAEKDTPDLQMEGSKEQIFTSELPVENLNHRTECHDEVVKEMEMLEKEGPQKPEAVIDQETIVAQASITEESQKIETISTVEMLDEEKGKETVKVKEEKCEDSSARETDEINEFHLVTKEETISYLAFSEEQFHSFSASAITSEESEHETKQKEDEKTSEGETIKYEIEDASDAKTTVEICSQKGSSVQVEAVAEDEMTADEAEKIESKKIEEVEFLQDDSGEDATLQKELLQGGEALVENNASSQTIPKEKPEEQIPNPVVSLPSEEHKHDTINEVEKTEEEKIKEEEMKIGDSDGVKKVEEVSTEKYQTKEVVTVFEEDESLKKIGEQTGEVEASSDINMEIREKGLNCELLDETEDAAIKENIGKAIDGSGGEANLYEKINEGNEIILNEVSKDVASHSTSQSEEPTKDGEDALKNELIEDKTYKELIVEAQKTSENEITEKQTKDEIVMNPGQASVVSDETTTVTEDHIQNMGITSSVVEEYVLIDLQERFVECSQKAEVRDVKTYPEVVEHGVEKTEDKLVEDSTKISSSDCVESFKEMEDEKMGEVEIIKGETEEYASDTRTAVEIRSQVDTSVKLEAFTENEITSGQTLTAKKSEELQNPASAPHSKEEQCVRASIAEEIESEKMEEEEFLQGDNEEDAIFRKEQSQGDEPLAVENKASLQTIPTEKSEERITNPDVTLSSEEHKHETVNEFDKPQEENMKKEVKNRDFDGGKMVEELSTEKDEIKGDAAMSEGEINHLHITASALPSDVQRDETNKTESKENESPKKIQEQTGETEEASNFTPEIHEKASDKETVDAAIKENIDKESDGFAQTNEGNDIILNEVSKEEIASYSTSHSEEMTKDASQEDAVKDERIEDKTCEEFIVEAQKTSEDEMNEKQIEGGLVEEQVQASIVSNETTTESSTELSVAEGKQILESSQQTGETTKTSSDTQIPRELDHIEKTGITSLVAEEHVPVYLQDRVAGSSQRTEVGEIYPGGVECGGEKTADCSGEVTESILTQNSIKISLSDNVESFAKEASQVPQDMIEGDAKDETNVSQILQAEKTEKQSLAPVDAVVEENKDPKAVVVQETMVTQSPQTKDSISHFEDNSQEDKHTGDETNEIFKIPTHEIQNEKPSVETQKDDANDNIRKATITEDEPVKGDMNEAPIVREIPGKDDPNECIKTTKSTGRKQFLTEQQYEAFETSDKAVVGDLEPGTAKEICSEAGVASGKAEIPDNSGVEKPEEPESEDSAKLSLYDLLQRSTRETTQGSKIVIEERELKVSNEEPPEEEAKTDEEVEGDENSKTESGTKPHKKPHNILSGMGSKVKHSISKMKKAITGKSSHTKESKPISPKESKK